jgi:alpha-beta hydrolase superfamily lysophospholipase
VIGFGKPVKLASFRFQHSGQKKGVIFFIHGFGSYIVAHANFLMNIAAAGYDIFAID